MNVPLEEKSRGDILVVDDTPENLQVLTQMLQQRGFTARPVPNGKLALLAAQTEAPDLILLDINMPEMDGYAVCAAFKSDKNLQDVPVIFISGMNDTLDKVRAFQAGGVDYITKPFHFEEVQARVETHLALRRQQRQLQENYAQIVTLEELRDNLVHMIIHDMRNLLWLTQVVLEKLEETQAALLDQEGKDYLAKAFYHISSLTEMSRAILDVSRLESGAMKLDLGQCDLAEMARHVVSNMEALQGGKQLTLHTPPAPALVVGDANLLSRVIQNLLDNALKFSPPDGRICITIEALAEGVRVAVQDNGAGIPVEYHEKIFEKFGQVETRAEGYKFSTGLGLTFCKLVVEAHGGRIGVISAAQEGSTFWFELGREVPAPGGTPANALFKN